MSSKLAKAPLVGRAPELARLEAALDAAAGGQGSAVLLLGEAGIGKTRLALEVSAIATKKHFVLLHGAAHAPEGDLAYAPLLQAIGPYLRALDGQARSRVLRGLDDIGRLLPDLATPPPSLGDPSLEKVRLLDAITRLLERMSITAPILLVLDDLHWADAATLELLHFLVRTLRSLRLLLVLTARTPEADHSAPLRSVRSSLRRIDALEEIGLERLDEEAARALTRALLSGEAPGALDEALERRARGVPLFVEALLRALAERGALVRADGRWSLAAEATTALPATIRDIALERLQRLDAGTRAVFDHLALDGGATTHKLLESVLGAAAIGTAVRPLEDAALITVDATSRDLGYEVVHPILAEVACADLSRAARRTMHVAMVDALERMEVVDLDRLGRHVRGAGDAIDPRRAVDALTSAARHATSRHAHELGTRHWSAAIEVMRAQGWNEPLVEALEQLGECWLRVGEGAAALAVLAEALAAHEQRGDATGIARTRRLLANAAWDRGLLGEARAHVAAGSAAADPTSQESFALLALDVSFVERVGDVDALTGAVERLRMAATRSARPRAMAEAELASAMLHVRRGAPVEAFAAAQRGLAGATALNDPRFSLRAHEVAMLTGMELFDHATMRRHTEVVLVLAKKLGAPTSEMRARGCHAVAGFLRGAYREALPDATAGADLAERFAIPRGGVRTHCILALLHARMGDWDRATRELGEARAYLAQLHIEPHVESDLVLFEAIAGLVRGAPRLDDDVQRVLSASQGWLYTLRLLTLAELQVATGALDAASTTSDRIRALGDHDWLLGAASLAAGIAFQAKGDRTAAARAFDDAIDRLRRIDLPFEAARATLLRAEVGGDDAGTFAEAACVAFAELGTARELDRARQVARSLGIKPPAVRREGVDGTPLSRREIEVARLFAQGLTAADVGKRLFISKHTATTHLHRIYDRLGIRTRAALAKYMVGAGLE